MRGNELLDKMELIDSNYVEVAEIQPKKKKMNWYKWGVIAACMSLIVGIIAINNPHTNVDENENNTQIEENTITPQVDEIILSEKSTAKVSIGADGAGYVYEGDLRGFTEEEMFQQENMYVFRGKVNRLTNITIDFNGMKEARCIAIILIDEVYKGNLSEGEQITMLLPCAIDRGKVYMEDSYVIANLENGMEGIFMPWIYDENSYMEMNGDVIMLKDLADCGLADGMRWVFMGTEKGLLFERHCYAGAENATNLEDIEAYVMKMLK